MDVEVQIKSAGRGESWRLGGSRGWGLLGGGGKSKHSLHCILRSGVNKKAWLDFLFIAFC